MRQFLTLRLILLQIVFPSGTHLSLGPYLSYIKLTASRADQDNTEGLCGTFDRDQDNEFVSGDGKLADIPLDPGGWELVD